MIASRTKAVATKTEALADETHALAEETKRLAAATEEDVSANWRPVIIAKGDLYVPDNRTSATGTLTVNMMNVGRGPAINIRVSAECGSDVERTSSPDRLLGVWGPGWDVPVYFFDQIIFAGSSGHTSLAYSLRVLYEDLAQRVYETTMLFMEPDGTDRHDVARPVALASVVIRERTDVKLQPTRGELRRPGTITPPL
jgi:hypothetical protein